MPRFIKNVLLIQAAYIFITAVWPIVHIESFILVTGPKTDIWLVKTVGALLIPVALCLFTYSFLNIDKRPAFVLGAGTSVAFITIDFYYALNDVIADIYLLDGIIEIAFLIFWIYAVTANKLQTR
jgi:hypothetical protein